MTYTNPAEAAALILYAISNKPALFMFDSDMTLVDWVSPNSLHSADPPQETKNHLHALHGLKDIIISFNTGRDEAYMRHTYQGAFAGAFAHGQYLRNEFGKAVNQEFPLPDFSMLDQIIASAISHRSDLKVESTSVKRVIHFPDTLTDDEALDIHTKLTQLIAQANTQTSVPLGLLTGNRIFEIGHEKAGKGEATLTLKKHYPDHITISAGDTYTDIPMLNHSHIAIMVDDMIPDDAIDSNGPSTVLRLQSPAEMREVVKILHAHLSIAPDRQIDEPVLQTGS